MFADHIITLNRTFIDVGKEKNIDMSYVAGWKLVYIEHDVFSI